MNPSYYKYCIVPQCESSTIKTPNKLFIYVPNNKEMRIKWLTLARKQDADNFSTDSRMYFCEDHFDLPNDMVNYMEYRVMGKVSQIRMKPGCIPRKFECQEDRRKRTCGLTERPFVVKKQRQMTVSKCLKEPDVLPEEVCRPSSSDKDTSTSNTNPDLKLEKMPETDKFVHTPGCIPRKFECQEDRRIQACGITERPFVVKKQRQMTISKCLKEPDVLPEEVCTPSSSVKDTSTSNTNPDLKLEKMPETDKFVHTQKANKSVQAIITPKFRSKATQTKHKLRDQALSPLKPKLKTSSTSPFKATSIKSKPSVSGLRKITRNILIEEEQSDSDISLYKPPSEVANSRSPSVNSLQIKSSDCSESITEDKKQEEIQIMLNTVKKIQNCPRLYIGIPSSCYYLIDIIKEELNIPEHYILLCLHKIRLDVKFQQLTDEYGMTSSYLSRIFLQKVPLIASVLRPFIVTLDNEAIKKNLPIAFRHNYHNVSCIIDCLEIEVQKPSKAVHQALTWSEYKKANTIKYLISCTPNGLVNYISPGFGGRTTDTCLVESCDFVETLKSGMCVMADRGFKHVDQYLKKSGITLVRPPTVVTGVKMSKSDAKLTKQIASLRIHVERVIRRLREFYMLKPHACINLKFVKIIDDIVIITCALINLQNSLIK